MRGVEKRKGENGRKEGWREGRGRTRAMEGREDRTKAKNRRDREKELCYCDIVPEIINYIFSFPKVDFI